MYLSLIFWLGVYKIIKKYRFLYFVKSCYAKIFNDTRLEFPIVFYTRGNSKENIRLRITSYQKKGP